MNLRPTHPVTDRTERAWQHQHETRRADPLPLGRALRRLWVLVTRAGTSSDAAPAAPLGTRTRPRQS
ncbi:hypothetical protein C7C46_12090 [Streptomyces tateyamensis]|uniref:Uncharacterized protein n=1 Tax=Streptomyces tateyamensis TaxID=565073 RepID=A0A2V4N9F9_9ACTN|nr:hypothetical protein [Streptomyces tateyamensis]PYC80878.1 hypothetical protein C7C46_12090 [Streptomyces tateyamensis]